MLKVDLRTEYEWNEDAPSQTVTGANVWKAKQMSGSIYEVTSCQADVTPCWAPSVLDQA